MDDVLEKLTDQEEKTRRTAVDRLYERASSNPTELLAHVPTILQTAQRTDDEYVLRNIGSTISTIATEVPLGTEHFDTILKTLDVLEEKYAMDQEIDPAGLSATNIFDGISQQLSSNQTKFAQALPILFKYLAKKSTVRYKAMGYVAPMTSRNPQLFAKYVPEIFSLVKGGFSEITSLLMQLYKFNPEAYEQNVDFLVEMTQDMSYGSLAVLILHEIAKKGSSSLLLPHIDVLKANLQSPQTAHMVILILGEIARESPELILPLIPDIQEIMRYNDSVKYSAPNLLGLVGRSSMTASAEMLTILVDLLDDPDQNVHTVTLMEIRNLGEMDQSLLDPYIEKIRALEDDPQEYIRDQAKFIIDIYEGRTIRALSADIDAQNKKISEMVHSVDDLKEYVDENVAELKDFLAQIAKKLPIPVELSTEGRIRKTLILHFVCGKEADRCLYPQDRTFTTETKEWSKWLKIGLSAVKVGKALITPPSVGDAVGAIKEAYEAYASKDDAEFLSYISQPFLTSNEQDHLINQLREARFFDIFNYDAQAASWSCIMCHPGT